jgi:hypothetical protein
VYRIMARSVATVASDTLLRRWADGVIGNIEARIADDANPVRAIVK